MSPFAHQDIEELLGAYALHAVDAEEAEVIERHLAGCPRCRSEVAGHVEVAALLAHTGGDAPDGLWDRISSQLEEAPPPLRLSPDAAGVVVPLASRRQARRRRLALAVVGAAAAVTVGVLGVEVIRQQDQLDRFEAAVEDGSLRIAADVAARDPGAVHAELTSPDGEVRGTVVLLPDGTGFLVSPELPSLEGNRTYQLWGSTDGGLISLGLLGAEPGAIVPFQAADSIGAVAITAEDAGGVVESQNAAVVAGDFD